MTLGEELDHGVLSKISNDEPIFVLRAKDVNAPIAIRLWAALGKTRSLEVSWRKLEEACQIANQMEDWATMNADGGKIPD